jgi:putative nucleotidyltransferase with HDIG domain
MIYAAEPDAFDADSLNLLEELAGDLAYGIIAVREHAEREAAVARWQASLEDTIGALASTVDLRDPYTAGHQERVAQLATAVGRELRLADEQLHGLHLAAIIHDIGKITIPTDILTKPAVLSKLEFELVKEHAQAGFEVVKAVEFPWPIAEIVRQHHERLDGSGYPRHLRDDEILLEAKILAVADVVEAMMSHRPYRPQLGIEAALAEIENGKGRLYDPAAVEACVRLFRQKSFDFR